jgi:hypothetical protein
MRGGSMTYRAKPKARRSGTIALLFLVAAGCSKGSIGDPEKSILPPGPNGYSGPNGPPVIDPVTGLPVDPVTGAPIDPVTGLPIATDGGVPIPGQQPLSCDPAKIAPGPSFVRRLNRFEYNNTIRDLLGDTSNPADDFPSEEKRLGFDNNATALQVSPALAEQYMISAEALAATAITKLNSLVPCDPAGAAGADACATTFIDSFGQKAYRRPLTADEKTTMKGVFDVGAATDFANGVRLVVQAMLQSAPFLYRVEFGLPPASGEKVVKLTSWEMASRLSYLIWQSMPDDALRTAAAADGLATKDQVAAQVTRMMADPRARDVFSHFHEQWLHTEEIPNIEKDTSVFTTFSNNLVPLMAEETKRFLDYVVWDGPGTLEALLTSPTTFVNGQLATYYGVPGASGSTFTRVDLDPATHAGILTQGGLMAMLGKANQTAPVHRGKFVREQILCHPLPPPPPDIMIKPPDVSPTLSTRERFAQHRTETVCATCHALMDPIGLGFENFDGAGHYRTTENGKQIDATGDVAQSDVQGAFNGPVELAHKLVQSKQVQACVVKSWFRYAYGRAETADDGCTLQGVGQSFEASQFDLKSLVVALTTTDAFLYRKVIAPGGAQ